MGPSAIALSDGVRGYDLSSFYRLFYPKAAEDTEVDLPRFQHDASKGLDRRLIGATILRCLNMTGISDTEDKRFSSETITRWISILIQVMPDICREIHLDDKLDYSNQLYA